MKDNRSVSVCDTELGDTRPHNLLHHLIYPSILTSEADNMELENKENNSGQEELENVSNLISSLRRLEIEHLTSQDLPELEHSLAQVTLDEHDIHETPSEDKFCLQKVEHDNKDRDYLHEENETTFNKKDDDKEIPKENDDDEEESFSYVTTEKSKVIPEQNASLEEKQNSISTPTKEATHEQEEHGSKDRNSQHEENKNTFIKKDDDKETSTENEENYSNKTTEKSKVIPEQNASLEEKWNINSTLTKEEATHEKIDLPTKLNVEQEKKEAKKDKDKKEEDDYNRDKSKVEKEEEEEDHSDDENPADDDCELPKVNEKPFRLVRRGPGINVQQNAYYHVGHEAPSAFPESQLWNFTAGAPSSGLLTPQHAQSPGYSGVSPMHGGVTDYIHQHVQCQAPQAISPGYPDMSPTHGVLPDNFQYNMVPDRTLEAPMSMITHPAALDECSYNMPTYLPPASDVDGNYYGSLTGSFIIPDSPPISSPDENENYQHGFGSSPPSPDQDINYLLEAIYEVMNNKETTIVPPQELENIIRHLTDEIEVPATNISQMRRGTSQTLNYSSEPSPPMFNSFQTLEPGIEYDNIPASHSQGLVLREMPDTEWKMVPDPRRLREARRQMARITNEELVKKDEDGDTLFIVLACQKLETENYTELLIAVLERLEGINLCCDRVINRVTKRCDECGNADQSRFYSPLGMKNHEGDSILSSVVKMKHPVTVINYIIEKISHSPSDVQRIFDNSSIDIYYCSQIYYPNLSRFL
nr:uncharacterized protein LOC128699442 isoform X3 [Cherax quadricarinatus]